MSCVGTAAENRKFASMVYLYRYYIYICLWYLISMCVYVCVCVCLTPSLSLPSSVINSELAEEVSEITEPGICKISPFYSLMLLVKST